MDEKKTNVDKLAIAIDAVMTNPECPIELYNAMADCLTEFLNETAKVNVIDELPCLRVWLPRVLELKAAMINQT